MALTLNNFCGFETRGLEELSATSGSPTLSTSSFRSGDYSLQVPSGATATFSLATIISDAGGGYIASFGYCPASLATGTLVFATLRDGAGNTILDFATDNGSLRIRDAGFNTLYNQTGKFSAGTWYFLDTYFTLSATVATVAISLDGTDIVSSTTANTGTAALANLLMSGGTASQRFDDLLLMSGATSASDRYGTGFHVKGYGSYVASATDNGSALNVGQWSNTNGLPWSELSYAEYTTDNANGSTDTDTTVPGPSGDSDVTGATIKGGKWVFSAKRDTGSNSSPYLRYGDTGGTTDTGDILTTSYAIYQYLSETTNVPSTSQYFRFGMGKGSGGRNVYISDAMGMLAFVTPEPSATYTLTAAAGAYTLSGVASAFKASRKLTAAAGSYTLTGVASAISYGRTLTAGAGSFSLSGVAAALKASRVLTAGQGTYTIGGNASVLSAARKLTAGAGSFTLSGVAANISRGYTLTASAGSFNLSGIDAALKASRVLTADAGSYNLSGVNAALARGYTLTASAGSFDLTGVAAALKASRVITAGTGAYALTGIDAILTYTPVGGPTYTLTAAAGSFSLAGVNAGLAAARNIVAGPGSFVISGQAAGLAASRNLLAGAGSFTITGNNAGLSAARKLLAGQGAFSLTGADATLTYTPAGGPTYTLAAAAGAYALTGLDAALTYTPTESAETPNTGGWIDPRVARRLLREARALQKAQEDKARDRRAEIERRRQSLHTTLERTYAELTGEPLPDDPAEIAQIIEAEKIPTPNNAAADAIAVYFAVMSLGDAPAMSAALDALDRALLAIRIAMQEADDEEVLLLAAY